MKRQLNPVCAPCRNKKCTIFCSFFFFLFLFWLFHEVGPYHKPSHGSAPCYIWLRKKWNEKNARNGARSVVRKCMRQYFCEKLWEKSCEKNFSQVFFRRFSRTFTHFLAPFLLNFSQVYEAGLNCNIERTLTDRHARRLVAHAAKSHNPFMRPITRSIHEICHKRIVRFVCVTFSHELL